ncbi:carboxymuconolactone decarboxylase family protein [Desulfosporosinus sp. PR]|uniref:carboxymuconolactone decarboxylase family protein n=1 Tax=Candidatus Desulfosporosinus nitrosoreducens TaxID=3401928 RepID=UPI0027E9B577|nr:carboxymuconolactone decarboxylase family protein [Desulfosporosinus sp. PR]MDQ7096579.1 carboxymuconolactone decarboxylase family protein [Desulfosporosinus sp. PR]
MNDEIRNKMDSAAPANVWQGRGEIKRPTEARIPLMDVSALSEEQRTLAGIGASNVLRTLAHRGDLMTAWLEFGGHLTTGGRVPFRTRELMILRVGLRSSCEYEWANHVPGALSAGVTASEIEALANATGSWSDADAAVLNLVDDLCADNCASEKTWKALTATRDEGEIIELLMLIGFYRMNAGFLNSLGVQAEPGRPRLGQSMSYEAPAPSRRPASTSTVGAPSEAKPDGIWQLKFYHPAATQELQLVMVTRDDVLSGTLTNEAAGITVPFSEGKVNGNHVTCTTVMTKPFPVTITWEGTIDGDFFAGTATIRDAGSFPFDGTRVG